MPVNMTKDIPIKDSFTAIFLFLFSFIIMLPCLRVGPVSDDFTWVMAAQNGQNIPWMKYLEQTAPFGYFRPLAMAAYRLLWLLFQNNFVFYRLIILALNSFTCIIIFYFLGTTVLPRPIPFLTAVIFAVMPCRAESLIWLCCINELLSAFLVSLGLYVFWMKSGKWTLLSVALFTLALFSRESALSFVFLLIFFRMLKRTISWKKTILNAALPLIFYAAARIEWSSTSSIAAFSTPGHIDINPFSILIRAAQYLIKMIIPVKSLMDITGFGLYGRLREIVTNPSENMFVFWSLSIVCILILIAVIYTVFKKIGKMTFVPLIFSILALSVYLPFSNSGERFLYFPAIGVALLLAMAIRQMICYKRTWAIILLVMIFGAYSFSLQNRIYRWKMVGESTSAFYAKLYDMTRQIPEDSKIFIRNLPSTKYGIPFLSFYTINDSWIYYYPSRKLMIYSDPAPIPAGAAMILDFQNDFTNQTRRCR